MKVRKAVVALLQPDAVRLLGERLADELERALVLVDEPGEDHVVGGDGVDLVVAQRLGALAVGVGSSSLTSG